MLRHENYPISVGMPKRELLVGRSEGQARQGLAFPVVNPYIPFLLRDGHGKLLAVGGKCGGGISPGLGQSGYPPTLAVHPNQQPFGVHDRCRDVGHRAVAGNTKLRISIGGVKRNILQNRHRGSRYFPAREVKGYRIEGRRAHEEKMTCGSIGGKIGSL